MTKLSISPIHPESKVNGWEVLEAMPRGSGRKKWLCRCSCGEGTERVIEHLELTTGRVRGCTCCTRPSAKLPTGATHIRQYKPPKTALHGETYGRLTVLDEAERSTTGRRRWSCACSCGTKTAVLQTHLVTGHTTSCGCYARERTAECSTTHGLSGTREYENALRAADPEKYRIKCREYYAKNKHEMKARHRKWTKENADHVAEYNARRRAEKLNAIPPWHKEETKAHVKELKKEARRLEKETGVKYHIDHVVPLKSALVSGLHVKDNLQLLTETENLQKNNRVWPSMP